MDITLRPAELARAFSDIGNTLLSARGEPAVLAEICRRSLELLPPAEAASISRGRHGSFVSVGATSPLAAAVDQIQYDLGSGPCVDAAVEESVFHAPDLRVDTRWPEFSRRATDLGVRSMLATRIYFEDDDLVAALNLFSTVENAFDDESAAVAMMLATHASLALTTARLRENVVNLEHAVQSNRGIGVAMGVLMNTYKITQTEAFDLLRMASQNTHRKLVEVAEGVTDTGMLDVSRVRTRQTDSDPVAT